MALPTFIIAGAPKSGTTALWAYLKEHPDICMARRKEPGFFSDDLGELDKPIHKMGSGGLQPGRLKKGMTWYKELFNSCHEKQELGEASVRYFSCPNSTSLIKSTLPHIKLIFLLRHPVERLYSQYWNEIRKGLKLPDFITMVKNNHPRFQYYHKVSSYKCNLERYYKNFPDNQILILINTDLKTKPLETIQQVFEFIGVDKTFIPENLGKSFNKQAKPTFPIVQRILMKYSARISAYVPEQIHPYLRPIRKFIWEFNLKERKQLPPSIPSSIRQQLAHDFEEDIVYVEKLLGRDLSTWRT